MSTLPTTDPRTGESSDTGIAVTDAAGLDAVLSRSVAAFEELDGRDRAWRAGLLRALADGLDADRPALLEAALAETGLPQGRLDGEISRSAFQLRLFAEVVVDGGYLEAVIDHAGPTPLGPGPDVRRMLVPIGPVAVFGASNFPFAFSVVGGDTASALAAGNPVVVKAHEAHPVTSRVSHESLQRAAAAYGAPEGTIEIVYGRETGAALVADPRVAAVGFTGSLRAGQALQAIIDARPSPIPFYGELSSLNPLVVTAGAVTERADAIVEGLFGSVTGSAGQLCTKPGLAFVPVGAAGDALVAGLAERAEAAAAQTMLTPGIHAALTQIQGRLVADGGARVVVEARPGEPGCSMTPGVLEIGAADVTAAVAEEAFGPLVVIVRYAGDEDLAAALAAVPHSLTATIHSGADEVDERASLTALVRPFVGRIVYDGYPTGVRVSWAMHHGGPWPSTNTLHTSVGATAIRRFLRPLAWQDAPADLLPPELRDGPVDLPRRVDGTLELATR